MAAHVLAPRKPRYDGAMPYALNFYHDQLAADGSTAQALPAAHRVLYVRHGSVLINGKTVDAVEALYCDEPIAFASAGVWSGDWKSLWEGKSLELGSRRIIKRKK